MDHLQIRNIEISGFGPLDHVIMQELGDRIILEGVNGVGKTHILDAIMVAFEGKSYLSGKPLAEWIKTGYESGLIKIELANGATVEVQIRVVITANDVEITVKELRGEGKLRRVEGGTMAFLKSLVNAIAFRPQQWRKKSDLEQVEEVFGFFPGLKEKLAKNGSELQEAEAERAKVLGRSKVLRLDIERAPFFSGLPETETDPAVLFLKLNSAKEHNEGLTKIRIREKEVVQQVVALDKEVDGVRRGRTHTVEMIARLQEQVADADAALQKLADTRIALANQALDLKGQADAFILTPVEPIEQEISCVQEKNEKIRKNAELLKKQRELEASEATGTELYRKIQVIKSDRVKIMSSAEIPIDGMSIGDGCLLYPNTNMDLVRLSALSDGEFWPVACGLIAAFNPRVAIMIIDNFYDLDKANFELLCAAAKKYGLQPWIHKTLQEESDAGAGFLIRGGEIVGAPRE